VRSVDVNRKQHRLTVSGFVEAKKVLKRVKRTGKRAELWPYIPYNLVQHPYVAQAYDKRAPSGFVRNVTQAVLMPNSDEERMTYLFSDDNTNACSIMCNKTKDVSSPYAVLMPNSDEERMTYLFSDDNTNACSIM
ncbi:heavy metal transport/detoxification superfamily protein, partial [Striga asiatica]